MFCKPPGLMALPLSLSACPSICLSPQARARLVCTPVPPVSDRRQACLPAKGRGACSPSQLQALTVPGPARILYCGSQALAGARIVPACCPQLLALGIRDERPVTPRFMGPGCGSKPAAGRGGLSAFDGVVFLCLLICGARCYPSPPCSLPILLMALFSALCSEGH